jgi:ABC-2 type transport system ATP-binding protein
VDAIAAHGLIKRYGDVQALDGVSFTVGEGEVFGLLGPNGAGKSTTVRILVTLTRADGGRAEVAGTTSRALGKPFDARSGTCRRRRRGDAR